MLFWLIILVSIFIGVGRLYIMGHDLSWPGTYEAFAHIWVGFLIGMGVYSDEKWAAWLILVLITMVEVIMFTYR